MLLKIWRVEQTCLFELAWNDTQTLSAKLTYPETLTTLYQTWQNAYLQFNRSTLRARLGLVLNVQQPEIDWRTRLVQAEAAFLAEFHYWLNGAELLEIRREITSAKTSTLYLRCDSPEVVKLPWESWQIGAEFGSAHSIQIIRTALSLCAEQAKSIRRARNRILVILGDETGLNFEAERNALQQLNNRAEIHLVGWQPDLRTPELLQQIRSAIADPKGWDILFFAGHSNETALTGGELGIAPKTSILMSEIAPQLKTAKERGLQFAIFNSCNGLSIAESLLNLGLSQVVVMREPIQDGVAKDFLIHFLSALSSKQNVQEATLSACQFLKLEKNLTYPSAYLIPSLFSHPQAKPFRLATPSWRSHLRLWKLNRREAIAVGMFALISSLLPIQWVLIDQRQLVQAFYRQIATQGIQAQSSPVLLVQINEESLQKDSITLIEQNLDRNYLAKIVDRISQSETSVVGIDYLLFRHQPSGDRVLAKSLAAAAQSGKQFVFAATQDVQSNQTWITALPEFKQFGSSGDMDLFGDPAFYARVIGDTSTASEMLPFAYQVVRLAQSATPKRPSHSQVLDRRNSRLYFQPITQFSALMGQTWLHPLIDFSVSPNQVYHSIPSWKFLRNQDKLKNTIVLIVPGGQLDAGVTPGEDYFISPRAFKFWQPNATAKMSGGTIHAYLVHSLLAHRMIIPIPDLWLVGVAAIAGKGTIILLAQQQSRHQAKWFFIVPALYGLVSLQVYISYSILLPFLLPTLTYLAFLTSISFKSQSND
ncbi:MAG: CHASE2 domain-containing protein [Leptolyngbyaceae cyanobacterium CSU_1_3]|nr:CHASE2 domain-containing protein [Leptolyngbyaceae cyanobacterium CSU_1_3]